MSRVVIVGNHWSALSSLAVLSKQPGLELTWIKGSGMTYAPITANLSSEASAQFLKQLAFDLDIELGDLSEGSFVREYKGKGFYPVEQSDELWSAEKNLISTQEYRFEKSWIEIEQEIRTKLDLMEINTIHEVPVEKIESSRVILASGQVVEFDQCVYADDWGTLKSVEGVPKQIQSGDEKISIIRFQKEFNPVSCVQVRFEHSPIGSDVLESFCVLPAKDPGEKKAIRKVWGYFFDGGRQSVWSYFITQEETEDNHFITKKIRRLKQALNKVFTGSEWQIEPEKSFTDHVTKEKVGFAESAFYSDRQPITHLSSLSESILLLTDGFGLGQALMQVSELKEKTSQWMNSTTSASSSLSTHV